MSNLYVLIGLPASGKSTIAKRLAIVKECVIHSSDEIRLELFGSYNVFDKNELVFDTLHSRIASDLLDGKNVIYDATNLSMKKRKAFLSSNDIKKAKSINHAVVIATNYERCIERDAHRNKKVGESVIKKMRESFQFPLLSEGFDIISVEYSDGFYDNLKDLSETFNTMLMFNQDNPNHNLTLGKHCLTAARNAYHEGEEVVGALFMHDIGKLYTKTYTNKKQEKTDIAHYYNHHNVSAYEYMFYFNVNEPVLKYTCQLINYHMQMYFIKTEKSKNKWLNIFGEKMYEDLLKINHYDKISH